MFDNILRFLGFEPDDDPKPNEPPNARLSQIAQLLIDIPILMWVVKLLMSSISLMFF